MAPFFFIMSRPISLEEQRSVIDCYLSGNPPSCRKVDNEKGFSHGKTRKILIRNNIPINRKIPYILNRDYFSVIDTEDKAYFLGLMYADGNVVLNKTVYRVRIVLQEKDKEILNKFNSYLGYEKPLKKVYKKVGQNQYLLEMNSSKMGRDLIKLGCIPAKSLTLKFPTKEQVPDHLIRHFIRGHFDGDGSIFRSTRNYMTCSISSTIRFNKKVKKIIFKTLKIKCKKLYTYKTTHKNFCNLRIYGPQAKTFMDWLYKDATVYIQRKYDRYKEYYGDGRYGEIVELTS